MLNELDASDDSFIIMDKGIATQASLRWLQASGHKYLVVSRNTTREFDFEEESGTSITTSSGENVSVYLEV